MVGYTTGRLGLKPFFQPTYRSVRFCSTLRFEPVGAINITFRPLVYTNVIYILLIIIFINKKFQNKY